MSKIEMSGNSQIVSRDPSMWKTAQKFEEMTIKQLFEPVFNSVDTSKGMFGGGEGEAAFRPFLTQDIASKAEQAGGFGLAEPVYAQMMKMQENIG